MLKDVKCLCGAEFQQVDLTKTDGWFTCPKCGCTTKRYIPKEPALRRPIPEYDMNSLVKTIKEKKF